MAETLHDPLSVDFLENETFDFIIVGGGTSGLVVASRLTENPNVKVLVLEAGANRLNDPRITIPGLAASLYDDPDFDWCFMSTPQENLKNRQLAQPKGRTLGGSTAINLGMVIYPSKSGIDGWEKLGNKGWNWESFSPYLRKFQTLTMPSEEAQKELGLSYVDQKLQGHDGPIQVSFGGLDAYTSFNKAWPKVFETLGHPLTGDPISGVGKGAFTNPGIVDPVTKTRSHAGSAYAKIAATRPNLHVLTEVIAQKLAITKDSNGTLSATGIHVITKDGIAREISATKEVILSAGTFGSPQLLELSGIGNPSILKEHNITPILENPNVGENLQDHGFVSFSWEIADGEMSGDALKDPKVVEAVMAAYQAGLGPLSAVPIASAFLPLVNYPKSEVDSLCTKYLDSYEYKSPIPSLKDQYQIIRESLRSPDDTSGQYTMAPFQLDPKAGPALKKVFGMGQEGNYISICAVLNHPFSRGSVHINSDKAGVEPTIDPRYFSHPLDLELHARHTQYLETLVAAEPLKSLLKPGGRRIINGEKKVETLEEAKEAVQDLFISHYHVVGTCAMLPKEKGGVVDERLRVYGVKGLRVVDASIFPIIPRGNIQASVYGVAEKAADIIKEDYDY